MTLNEKESLLLKKSHELNEALSEIQILQVLNEELKMRFEDGKNKCALLTADLERLTVLFAILTTIMYNKSQNLNEESSCTYSTELLKIQALLDSKSEEADFLAIQFGKEHDEHSRLQLKTVLSLFKLNIYGLIE